MDDGKVIRSWDSIALIGKVCIEASRDTILGASLEYVAFPADHLIGIYHCNFFPVTGLPIGFVAHTPTPSRSEPLSPVVSSIVDLAD
jgi:hypothetical protein